VVGSDHFSEWNVAVQDGLGSPSDDYDTESDSSQQTTDGSSGHGTGFDVGGAAVALTGATLVARHCI
jgi:hypothetical protein